MPRTSCPLWKPTRGRPPVPTNSEIKANSFPTTESITCRSFPLNRRGVLPPCSPQTSIPSWSLYKSERSRLILLPWQGVGRSSLLVPSPERSLAGCSIKLSYCNQIGSLHTQSYLSRFTDFVRVRATHFQILEFPSSVPSKIFPQI